MSRVAAGLQVVTLVLGVVVAATGAHAQGLVKMQKLAAPLANELVGEAVANCAQQRTVL
jgi:hypothetical protein